MDAGAKLDRLRNEWFVYAVVVAILRLIRETPWDSLVSAALRVAVTYGLAWYVTKELREKSSLVWAFGVAFGLLGALAAVITIVSMLVELADGGSFELIPFLLALASGYMHLRVFRVLRDRDVKRHVM